jgi:hypothetical protein
MRHFWLKKTHKKATHESHVFPAFGDTWVIPSSRAKSVPKG